jgi:hypothetical protein
MSNYLPTEFRMKEHLHSVSYTVVNFTLLSLVCVCVCVCVCVLLTDSNLCLIQACICHYL